MSRVLDLWAGMTGTVLDFAGSAAPDGWLLCYGQAISRSDYSVLFAKIGTTFGAGDGSTTFNLPDCRGRVSAGKDNMGGTAASRMTASAGGIDAATLGAAGGAATHALTVAQMPSHTHTYDKYAGSSAGSSPSAGTGSQAGFSSTASGSNGNGDPHPITQPTLVLNKIIKT